MAYSKIGFHSGPTGNMSGIGDFWRGLSNAGIPIFHKAADGYGPLYEIAELVPNPHNIEHHLVYRMSTKGQGDGYDYDVPPYHLTAAEAAAVHWQHTRDNLPPEFNRQKVWIEPINEVDKNKAGWLGNFAVAIAKLANAEGYKVTLFGWSSGEPEPAHWQTPGMIAYLQYCAAHPTQAAVSVHEYNWDFKPFEDVYPHHVGRFLSIHAACDAHGIPYPTIHITEWGWALNHVPTWPAAEPYITACNQFYTKYPHVKGAAIWNLGKGPEFGNVHNETQKLIAPLGDYTLATTFPDPNPEPEPPPIEECHGSPREQYSRVVWVVAGEATAAQRLEVYRRAAMQQRTVTVSFDDGGIGDLNSKTAVLHGISEEKKPTFTEWFKEHYPGTVAQFAPLAGSDFRFTHWPTEYKIFTQPFGANPDTYAEFGLPGHEGLDIRAPHQSRVFAAADGVVSAIRQEADGHNYGRFVRILHAGGYETTYAHLYSISVKPGDSVVGGQEIGRADNTGNSFGAHLHLTLKHPDAKRGGGKYIGYPSNIIDPTPYIEHLRAPAEQSMVTTVARKADAVKSAVSTLLSSAGNCRGVPRVQYSRVYWVVPGNWTEHQRLARYEAAAAAQRTAGPSYDDGGIGDLTNKTAVLYGVSDVSQVAAFVEWYAEFYPGTVLEFPDVVTAPPAVGTALFGIHASADSRNLTDDVTKFQAAKPGVVKVLSGHAADDVSQLRQVTGASSWIIRAFLDFGGRAVTASQFVEWTLPDVRRTVDRLRGAGVIERNIWVELHNEPNLTSEGLDTSWGNGTEFAGWFMDVLRAYRTALPGLRYLYPGLSPGPNATWPGGRRLSHRLFWSDTAVNVADGVAVHSYWSPAYPMQSHPDAGFNLVNEAIARWPSKPIWITEASNNSGAVIAAQKVQEYIEFWRWLRTRPTVQGVTYFVMSASNPAWHWTSGSGEVWTVAMATAAGGRVA